MLRTALFAVALAGAAAMAAPATAPPDLTGSWLVSYTPRGSTNEINVCIVKIDTKDGKATAAVVAAPGKGAGPTVKSFEVTGTGVALTLSSGASFAGAAGDDAKVIPGGFGNDTVQFRARMTRTEKDTVDSQVTPGKPVDEMAKAQKLTSRPLVLRNQARQEKDAGKKKEILAQAGDAQKEADEQVPALYREVVKSKPTDPAAMDAAFALLQAAGKWKVTPAEAKALVGIVEKQSAAYGPKYAAFVTLEVAEALVNDGGLAATAVDLLRPRAKALTDKDPAPYQVKILSAYKTALQAGGQADEATAVDGRLAKLETKLDEEYHATVPPFKPTAFAGRQDKAANRVAVLELFTGAQCPPCVSADVAFDALGKSYKATDLVLIQYHMHIPGPDPLTNPDTIARWDYYAEKFPQGIRGTPTTLYNGKVQGNPGGYMEHAEDRYGQFRKLIDPILEKTTPVKVSGKATRKGDKVEIAVDVAGAPTEGEVKLRVLVVEESVKYVGGNRLRFHHQVVRGMPGGAAGVAVKDGGLRHTTSADLVAVRKDLNKYLDGYAAERPFPSKVRPLDLKDLKVIALVQDDKTGEIVQAAQFDVTNGEAGGGQ